MKMLITALLLPLFLPAMTVEPQQIISITQELHEMTYYESQAEAWQLEVENSPQDANAWMNYYLASRIVNILTPDQNPVNLQAIYEDLSGHIADTYEYHYLSYLNGGTDPNLEAHIYKAYEMDPQRPEAYSHLIKIHTIKGDMDEAARINEQWLKTGAISQGILNWNYNALIALDENAILLTHGDNDTYPSWMLQQVHKVRPDVKIMNIYLLRDRTYADRVFLESGLPVFPSEGDLVWENDLVPLVDHIFQHASRAVYINVTLPKRIRDNYKEVLYTVGLAFKYSPVSFDNITALKNNFENKFLIDYLKVGFSYDKSASVLASLNVNYLPSFVSLYKYYLRSEEEDRAEEIKAVIENIGKASGREEELATVLERPLEIAEGFKTHIDIKAIDKNMKQIHQGLWADEAEMTNEYYYPFLMDLLQQKEYDLLERCKAPKVEWMSLMPAQYKHLSQEVIFKNGSPEEPRVPVCNITYDAAVLYCEWLTLAYNAYPKKKKHAKVLFRLPTEEEWEYAASAGKEVPYPWGGYYHYNSKGCYLSNFDSIGEAPCEDCTDKGDASVDGGFFMVRATSYFPNDKGLFGLSGNVAEMVAGGEIAKGGSWEDSPEDCKIQSVKKVEGPSPAIGFRVFMEVIK